MAFSRGPKIITDGLVVNLDVGNLKSFKGIPATNLLNSTGYILGTNNTTLFKTNYGSETVSIPKIQGTRTSNYCNIYNDYNGGSGQCCLAVFGFGDISVSPNTVYTYQIIYRTTSGYNHPNYMYHYEYNGGTYVTEYGLLDNSRIEDLGDGWKHAWGTFTSNPSTNRFVTYMFHYEYGIQNKVQVAGVSLTQGSTIHDPSTLLPISTTRGANSCLIDTSIKTNDGNLFNGIGYTKINNGALSFDGVDDEVTITSSLGTLSNYTISFWARRDAENKMPISSRLNTDFYWYGDNSFKYYHGGVSGEFYYSKPTSIPLGTWGHYVAVYNGSNISIYRQGVLQGSQNTTGTADFSQGFKIGSWNGGGGYNYLGLISNIAIYDKALSETEVKQNYNATKSRYGL